MRSGRRPDRELPRVLRRVEPSQDEPHDDATSHPAYRAESRKRGGRPCREDRAIAPTPVRPAVRAPGVRGGHRDAGPRAGLTSAGKDRFRALEREDRELRSAHEVLSEEDQQWIRCLPSPTKGQRIFRGGSARARVQTMLAFITLRRGVFAVGPIRRVPHHAHTHHPREQARDRNREWDDIGP